MKNFKLNVDAFDELAKLRTFELNAIAKKLGVKGIGRLKKVQKVKYLAENFNGKEIRTALGFSWWKLYQNHLYGAFTVLAFIAGILFYIFPKDATINPNNLRQRFEKYVKKEEWGKLADELNDIRAEGGLKDIYNYFKGITVQKTLHVTGETPELYFNSIAPESRYFIPAQKKLASYYRNVLKDNQELLKVKLNDIAERITSTGRASPFSNYLKLTARFPNFNYSALLKEFEAFTKKYNSFMDFTVYRFSIKTKTDQKVVANFRYLHDMLATTFFYRVCLAVTAHNMNLTRERDVQKQEIIKIINSFGQSFVRGCFGDLRQANVFDISMDVLENKMQ